MNPFASRTTETIDLPFDPPHTATIRKLAGRHLEKAKQENQFASVDALRRMGGVKFQQEIAALGDQSKEAIAKFQADPMNEYDLYVLLRYGVIAWSYSDPVTPEQLDDLVDDAVQFLAAKILRLSKPALFQSAEEYQAAQKNA